VGVGPGVSYYFEALNLYTSFTLALTRIFGKGTNSELGLGTNLVVGKEWWLSTNWGTGVAVGLQTGIGNDKNWGSSTSMVPSLLWSSTWN